MPQAMPTDLMTGATTTLPPRLVLPTKRLRLMICGEKTWLAKEETTVVLILTDQSEGATFIPALHLS